MNIPFKKYFFIEIKLDLQIYKRYTREANFISGSHQEKKWETGYFTTTFKFNAKKYCEVHGKPNRKYPWVAFGNDHMSNFGTVDFMPMSPPPLLESFLTNITRNLASSFGPLPKSEC